MEILIDYAYREDDLCGLPIRQLALAALSAEEMPDDTEVSITFVDDDEIARLNAEYRGKTGPTDVLSFECDMDETDELFPDGEIFELGDIVIAPDVAERQCEIYGTTFEQEISLLLVHGLLHLCGYDHIEDDEAAEMQARERDILGSWFASHGFGQSISEEPIAYEAQLIASRIAQESALPKSPEER